MSTDTALTTLADILERENEALRELDISAAAALAASKQAALSTLETLPNATPAPAAEAAQILPGLVAENRALLERAIRVQARVIEIVASAYRPAPATRTYGPSGEPLEVPLSGVAFSTQV